MARKQVDRSLPPLKKAFETFPGFTAKSNRQAVLLNCLRIASKKLRGHDTLPFYAMRDVAAFFKVPLRTVAIAYEQLELEGFLNRIRGSKTLLTGKTLSPSKPVRAVIGIPLWLHAIVVSPYSRKLHWELEERLRQYGFVADIIFFRGEEVSKPDFTERLLHHNLDYIIWHTPHPLANQVLLSLKDSGVRQIIVQPADNPISMNMPTYLQDWHGAYHEMATEWMNCGIRNVVVPEPLYLPSQKAMKGFSSILKDSGLNVHWIRGSAPDIKAATLKYPPKSCGVAFLDQLGAEAICNEEPVVIETIMQRCRLAFCRGPIRVPYFFHRNASSDLVGFSAVEVATRLANDIRDNNLPPEKDSFVFKAKYDSHIPFRHTVELL